MTVESLLAKLELALDLSESLLGSLFTWGTSGSFIRKVFWSIRLKFIFISFRFFMCFIRKGCCCIKFSWSLDSWSMNIKWAWLYF